MLNEKKNKTAKARTKFIDFANLSPLECVRELMKQKEAGNLELD